MLHLKHVAETVAVVNARVQLAISGGPVACLDELQI